MAKCIPELNALQMPDCKKMKVVHRHVFFKGKYYIDDEYWGDVIKSDEHSITVKCNNGVSNMQGEIINISVIGKPVIP